MLGSMIEIAFKQYLRAYSILFSFNSYTALLFSIIDFSISLAISFK